MTSNRPTPPAPPSEGLPTFVCLVSVEQQVLSYGHASTEDEAHAWCMRARSLFVDHADQVAIATPVEVDWIGLGRAITLAFWAGWTRTGFSWQAAEPPLIRLHFDELPPGPTPCEELRAPELVPAGVSMWRLERELRAAGWLLLHLARGMSSRVSEARQAASGRPKLLLVNGDSRERCALRDALIKQVAITEAESFSGALLELAYWDFDVVITKQETGPVGTGLHLLEEIRNRWPRVRRVLCAKSVEEIQQAVASGVAQHVLKAPLDAESLSSLLV